MTAPTMAYWYDLHVEIEPTDVAMLIDALEDEDFALRDHLGEAGLVAQIRSRELLVEARVAERWSGFDRDLEILSIYLSQYIVGREVVVTATAGAPRIRGWKVAACRGEVVRLDLDLLWDFRADDVIDRGEDLDALVSRWAELPEWTRSALRVSHPRLRSL